MVSTSSTDHTLVKVSDSSRYCTYYLLYGCVKYSHATKKTAAFSRRLRDRNSTTTQQRKIAKCDHDGEVNNTSTTSHHTRKNYIILIYTSTLSSIFLLDNHQSRKKKKSVKIKRIQKTRIF